MITIHSGEHYRAVVETVEANRHKRDPSPPAYVAEVVVQSRHVVAGETTVQTVAEPYADSPIAPDDVIRHSERVPADDSLEWREAAVEALRRDLEATGEEALEWLEEPEGASPEAVAEAVAEVAER